MTPLNVKPINATLLVAIKQEITMFKHESEFDAPEVLSDAQLDLVSGGATPDGNGNIPICPPSFHGHLGGGTAAVKFNS